MNEGMRIREPRPHGAAPGPSPFADPGRERVAIIGIDARLPGSRTLDELWSNLVHSREVIARPPPERRGWSEPKLEGPVPSEEAGYLTGADRFDGAFFGISDEEAELMDPLQRLALQSAWHCIEDAGYRTADLAKAHPGVFFATGKSDFEEILYRRDVAADAKLATGIASGMVANRISFALGFNGPSLTVDTACSGSLTALHLALQALREGDCGAALVGAVNLCLTPTLTRSLEKEGTLSPDRRTRSFDAGGNGYARGEGAISLLLKPLSQALAERDHVYATILGSAVGHGGRANWLTAPNPSAQKQVIATAWRRAGIDPRSITYLEAHATATPLGDSIEFNAIRQARSEATGGVEGGDVCHIGSVKPNIGHLEVASGLAGIVKVVLAMKHAFLPGNPLLRRPNPLCKTAGTPFRFLQEARSWDRPVDESGAPLPLRAGVSAFGFGGACAHVVVEEYGTGGASGPAPQEAPVLAVLPVAARDLEALHRYATALEATARAACVRPDASWGTAFDDLLYAFQVGRTPFPARMAVLADGWASLADALEAFRCGRADSRVLVKGTAAIEPEAAGDEMAQLSREFAANWVNGESIEFAGLYGGVSCQKRPAPVYPFAEHVIGFGRKRSRDNTATAA